MDSADICCNFLCLLNKIPPIPVLALRFQNLSQLSSENILIMLQLEEISCRIYSDWSVISTSSWMQIFQLVTLNSQFTTSKFTGQRPSRCWSSSLSLQTVCSILIITSCLFYMLTSCAPLLRNRACDYCVLVDHHGINDMARKDCEGLVCDTYCIAVRLHLSEVQYAWCTPRIW